MPGPGLEALLASARDGVSRVHRDGMDLVLKRRLDAPGDFFQAEARGLEALAATRTLRVPRVWAVTGHGIVLEDLGRGTPSAAQWERAGTALATLHSRPAVRFGSAHPGWCGDSVQDNTPDTDGHRFFAERRLLPQARRAHASGRLPAHELSAIESLCDRLPALLPRTAPVPVHGDLWTGNLHACADGELALIDGGAVHRGWAETDLAMLVLFGAPPRRFFDAYQHAAGIGADWRARAPLLNLYPLLNHLNLFGTGYLPRIKDVLAGYR